MLALRGFFLLFSSTQEEGKKKIISWQIPPYWIFVTAQRHMERPCIHQRRGQADENVIIYEQTAWYVCVCVCLCMCVWQVG